MKNLRENTYPTPGYHTYSLNIQLYSEYVFEYKLYVESEDTEYAYVIEGQLES